MKPALKTKAFSVTLLPVLLAAGAHADDATDAEWKSFARFASVVTCAAVVPSIPEAKRIWSAYNPKLTAYRWGTFGWVFVLEVRPNPQSASTYMGFVSDQESYADSGDVPSQRLPSVTVPAPHVGGSAFVNWAADFQGQRPVLVMHVYNGDSQRSVTSPLSCKETRAAPTVLP